MSKEEEEDNVKDIKEDTEIETFLCIASEFTAMNKAATAAVAPLGASTSHDGQIIRTKMSGGQDDETLTSLQSVDFGYVKSAEEEYEASKQIQHHVQLVVAKSRSLEEEEDAAAIDCFPDEEDERHSVRFNVNEDDVEFDAASLSGSVGRDRGDNDP
eukprot:CAMPEP_0181118868 /NCGR_PEP_ID=MMETSP1071-20121207/23306_1 /TAXON_ID=35127 /ORGANISM="Thalassiosira sp., Strain NH16" /LENGTH=156 /DNA_ID=CAMNT_0023203393 /DNA_START=38 /DNA_END=508 /DNA_ORIENTATION=+